MSPSGATSCSSRCPSNTYLQGAAACEPCPAGSASFPGSTDASQCIANACAAYSITSATLTGGSSQYCERFDIFSVYVCPTLDCNVGFSWQDASPQADFAASCLSQSNTYPTIILQVNLGVQCNSQPEAPATLNGQSVPAGLAMGGSGGNCVCNNLFRPDIVGPFTCSAYALAGSNSIVFSAPQPFGFTADDTGTYAWVIISS